MIDVLVIEDDLTLLDTYKEILDDLNLKFTICKNAHDIMKFLLKEQEFKIGIFDINLNADPLDGITLLKSLRLHGNHFVPIIISGNISGNDISNFCEEDIQYVIRKPANPELLIQILKNITNNTNEKSQV